jgi:hypothetical protein
MGNLYYMKKGRFRMRPFPFNPLDPRAVEMPAAMPYEAKLDVAIQAFPGTPEEFGATLQTATSVVNPPSWDASSKESWIEKLAEKSAARRRILVLPYGQEILMHETRFVLPNTR